ncbi:MAG: polyprenol monophosphomannose synthase [Bryobacterales bacterium]|nr:polyprenol monophosphomannose synthase [Bryobacteraceae bacterium]MDW8354343.1 polyprenol monophosphomannose synthase [Bryobacterales bacterium]
MRAVAVVPTYNERDNLPLLVAKIREHAPELDLLIVDDNSPDGTGQLAEELGRDSGGRLRVLHRASKQGLGRAYVAGFQQVLAEGYDIIVQMDADLSHDPSFLPQFFDRIREADLVLGSRYLHGIAVVNWDFKRLLLSKSATAYVRLVTGMPFTDLTGGFKCWRRSALEAVGLEDVFANGYLFQIETTYRVWRKGFRIAEVPIIFFERNLGASKMDLHVIWEALWGVIRLRMRA